jgi:hypothetical protein
MIKLLGIPGRKTENCSDPTGDFAEHVTGVVDVGPFRVRGLNAAVESLRQVFAALKRQAPQVHDEVRTDELGMLCVRHIRNQPDAFSNHSWGTAIDLKFGPKEVGRGEHVTQRGFLSLFPIFNRFGWFWGAGFSRTPDSMHFEVAEETIARMIVGGVHERITRGQEIAPIGRGRLASDPDLVDVVAGQRILSKQAGRQRGVGAVQDALIELGERIDLGSGGANRGIFGPRTEAAVKSFQGNAGIDVDGSVGPDTIKALDLALAEKRKPRRGGRRTGAVRGARAGAAHPAGPCEKETVLDDSVTIFKLKGRPGFFYRGRMTVDADGAPKCYHPKPDDNLGLDDLANSTSNSRRFIQGKNGVGPAPGFFVSQTSLQSGAENRCDSFVDAENSPYIVFYGERKFPSIKLGDIAIVVSLVTGKRTHAIVADGNNKTKGEASMKTAKNLGVNPSPRKGGDEQFNFIYLIFPDSKFDPVKSPPHWPDAKIKAIADAKFAEWGGMAQLRNCFPQIPADAI